MHDEVLTKTAAEIMPRFAKFKEFYLVGGTALALQIGHRRSIDFDFFSDKPLPARLLERAKRSVSPDAVSVTYRSAEQLNVSVRGIKATFLFFDYPVVKPLLPYKGLSIASVHEIAAMKAFSIGKRLSFKDYVDWYFLLKEHHVEIKEVIAIAQKKFGGDFNDRLFLGQLVSLSDVPTQTIDFLRGEVTREEIGKFLDNSVRKFNLG